MAGHRIVANPLVRSNVGGVTNPIVSSIVDIAECVTDDDAKSGTAMPMHGCDGCGDPNRRRYGRFEAAEAEAGLLSRDATRSERTVTTVRSPTLSCDMPDDAPVEVRLAEYGALRQEIQNRSGLQQTLLGLNITAIAAIGGVVLSRRVSAAVLLVLPPINLTLGFLWMDHDRVIHDLARYIRTQLWIWTPDWQQEHRRGHSPGWFWTPIGFMWAGPSIGALVAAPASTNLRLLWWLWASDALILGLFVLFFVVRVRQNTRDTRQRLLDGRAPPPEAPAGASSP